MEQPISLQKTPIVDAILEIRFSSDIPRSAVFGVVYNALRERYPKVDELPILRLPQQVIESDPNLAISPQYKLVNKDFTVQVGPNVIVIGFFPKYGGWKRFSSEIHYVLDRLKPIGILGSVTKVGLRYINFIEGDVLDQLEVKVTNTLKGKKFRNTVIKTEVDNGIKDYQSFLSISNNGMYNNKVGTMIDFEVFRTKNLQTFFSNKESYISKCHSIASDLFFNLINKKLLSTFKPIYKNE